MVYEGRANEWRWPLGSERAFVNDWATRLVYGPGRRHEIWEVLAGLGSRRPTLVCSQRFAATAFLAEIRNAGGGRDVQVYTDLTPGRTKATLTEVRSLARAVASHDSDGLLAIGGGAVMDAVKCALAELLDGGMERPVPFVVMPTTAGPGTETTGGASTRDPDTGERLRVRGPQFIPRVALLDPELTVSMDAVTTIGTGVVAFAHCVEALYSTATNPVAQQVALGAAQLIFANLAGAVERPDDLARRGAMMLGSALAGTAMNNTYTCLHHGLCHPLGIRNNVPHGSSHYILLPHSLAFNFDWVQPELQRLGLSLGLTDHRGGAEVEDAAADAVAGVGTWLAQFSMPRRLRDTGRVAAADLRPLAESALHDAPMAFNPRPITSADELERIYRAAW